MDRPLPKTPNYAYDRLDGKYRDRPKIYDPEQLTPVNLFTDIDHDRSYHLVKDARAHRGIRIFSPREQANLHTFPKTYTFVGSDTAQYGMVVDSVMPHMAYAIAQASKDYLRAIPALAERPMALGHRILPSLRAQQDEEIEEARQIIAEPSPRIDPTTTHQLALW